MYDIPLKVMEKEKIMKSQSQIKHANQEKMIMMGLEHPNIVRLWYAFQTPSKMYVLTATHLSLADIYPSDPRFFLHRAQQTQLARDGVQVHGAGLVYWRRRVWLHAAAALLQVIVFV
jgi:hypothetical protein